MENLFRKAQRVLNASQPKRKHTIDTRIGMIIELLKKFNNSEIVNEEVIEMMNSLEAKLDELEIPGSTNENQSEVNNMANLNNHGKGIRTLNLEVEKLNGDNWTI